MSDLDILTKVPKTSYKESAPCINAGEFQKVIDSRRSVRVFTDEKIPEETLSKCIEAALKAPNSSNLQPWQFYRVKSDAKKKQLVTYCMNQSAAKTASELIVCVARMDKWREVQKQMLQHFDGSEKKVPRGAYTYYKKIVPFVYTLGFWNLFGLLKKILFFIGGLFKVVPREPTTYGDLRVWAHKSTALACENLMLALRAHGFDSCPMEGHDSKRVRALLELKGKAEVCMVIAAGKRGENGIYGKQIRMPREHFYYEI